MPPVCDTTIQGARKCKIWGFSPPDGNRINRLRQHLAYKRKRRPCVHYSSPNLALISREVGIVVPDIQNLPQIAFFATMGAITVN